MRGSDDQDWRPETVRLGVNVTIRVREDYRDRLYEAAIKSAVHRDHKPSITDFVCFAADELLRSVESGKKPKKKKPKPTPEEILEEPVKKERAYAGHTRKNWQKWWDEMRELTDPPRAKCHFTERQMEQLIVHCRNHESLREDIENVLRQGLEEWVLGRPNDGAISGQRAWNLEMAWLLKSPQNMSKFLAGNYCKRLTRAELRKQERDRNVWDNEKSKERDDGIQPQESAASDDEDGGYYSEERSGYGVAEDYEGERFDEDTPF